MMQNYMENNVDFEDFHSNVNEEDALKDLDQLNKWYYSHYKEDIIM